VWVQVAGDVVLLVGSEIPGEGLVLIRGIAIIEDHVVDSKAIVESGLKDAEFATVAKCIADMAGLVEALDGGEQLIVRSPRVGRFVLGIGDPDRRRGRRLRWDKVILSGETIGVASRRKIGIVADFDEEDGESGLRPGTIGMFAEVLAVSKGVVEKLHGRSSAVVVVVAAVDEVKAIGGDGSGDP